MKRRRLLEIMGGIGLGLSAHAVSGSPKQRVVILGGAWAGLSAAHELRQRAPGLDVLLIDREAVFRSLPLSSPWLVDRTRERMAPIDRSSLAAQLGYGFVAAQVTQIDRTRRRVVCANAAFEYDWLLVATGLSYDYSGWFGTDTHKAMATQEAFPAGYVANELDALKRRLHAFKGGTLLMNVPAPPNRCPPAPYERAMLLAWWLKKQGIKGKLTLLDAGGGLPRFTRLFAERYPGLIDFQPHSLIRSIDPFARRVTTDDGDIPFDHAMLLPPMRAGTVLEQAGLLESDPQGRRLGWGAVDPMSLRSPLDDRVYLAGDLIGTVSPLFGYYPKTAHMATELGVAAARQIAARSVASGAASPVDLPSSVCHVWLSADPAEQMRLETRYRMRGDGVIAQAVNLHDNPQPRDEDLEWGRELYGRALGASLLRD
jgi:NADPH-dependent 2,4-dienoyl-CoA reductase/sulfur reductase-like enzyme